MEAQQPQDDHNAPDETPAPARPSLVARLRALVLAPLRIGKSLVMLILAPVRKVMTPLVRLLSPVWRLPEALRTQILRVLGLLAGPLKKLAGPAAKVVAPLKRLGFLVRPLLPLWNRVASRVPVSQRWKIAAIAGVATVLIMAEVSVRLWLVENEAKQFPEVTAAMALDVLDQGDYREAKKLVEELSHWTLTPQQKSATEYVLGAIAAHDALEFEGRRQVGIYAIAAEHLQQAREHGLPRSRIGKGMYLLGKCLHGAGQAAASRAVLEEALDTATDRTAEIHWLLADNYRQCEPRDLQRALEHCDKYLADDALVASDRQQGLLQRGRILFDLGKLDECGQTLDQIPTNSRFHSYVLVMHARTLIYEARGLTAAAGQPDAAVQNEARVKYQDAMDLLRQAQSRGQQEMQATRESSYLIGMCLLETHDPRAARDQFSRTARMYLEFEEGTAAALREADLLREAEQDDEAIIAYGHAVGAAGTAATYRNAYVSLDEFREHLSTAFKVYAIGKQFEKAVQIADLSEPLLTRDLRIPMAAEAHQGWAAVLLAKAEVQRLSQATTTRQMAREQLRLAGKEYLQAARLRLSSRQHPEDLWQAVQCFMDGHDYVRAVLAIDEYMSVEPRQRRPQALLNLGEARLALGQFDKAQEAFNECIESFASDAASYRARLLAAKTFIELEQYDKAETLLRDNLNGESLTPASAEWRESLYALGNLLHLVGRYDDAIASLDEAVARYPDAPEAVEARYLLAESYRRAAQKPKEKLQSATIESARIAHAKQMQQLLALAVANYEQVQDTLIRREEQTELTQLEQTILRNCCFLRGAALFDAARYEDSIRAYSIATNRYQHDPEVLAAYLQIASCYQRLDRQDETRGTLEQAKMVLKRIKEDAPFAKVTNYDRQEWSGWLDWMLRMEQRGHLGPVAGQCALTVTTTDTDMNSTSTDTERLSELMGHKHALLIQLRDLGKRQLESIDAGDVGQLLKVLSAKQRLLTTLHEVERGLDPFRSQNPDARRWRTAEDRQQCAQLVVRCEALLNDVMQQEKLSEGQLKLRRDEAHHRLQGAHAAAEARGAYSVSPGHSVGQLDVSSGS